MSIEGSYKKLAAANLRRTERYVKRIEQLLSQATGRFISLSSELPYDKSAGQFYFEDYTEVKKAVEETASRLARGMEQVIVTGTTTEWTQGTKDANGILDYMVQRVGIKSLKDLKPEVVGKYLNNHDSALAAFQKRSIGGMGLSERVWNLANQSKIEAELARSIAEGASADSIAESMQELLNQPGNLFRRVRDEFGVLQLSKRASSYNPGPGVYRSSFQNARRLARTEINMAYRNAEQESYREDRFCVGIEIHRSNAPYDCPICEALVGKYPKDFKWNGWHPNCRCFMTPILVSDDEFIDMLGDESIQPESSDNYVGDVPNAFNEWVSENRSRIEAAESRGSLPYFLRDNRKYLRAAKYADDAAYRIHVKETLEQYPIEYRSQLKRLVLSAAPSPKISACIADAAVDMEQKLLDVRSSVCDRSPSLRKLYMKLSTRAVQNGDPSVKADLMEKIKRKLVALTWWDLRQMEGVEVVGFERNFLAYASEERTLSATGRKFITKPLELDVVRCVDKNGLKFTYEAGFTKDTMFKPADAAKTILGKMYHGMVNDLRRNGGVLFAHTSHPLDEFYELEYKSFDTDRLRAYSSRPVSIHGKVSSEDAFIRLLSHEVGHHIDDIEKASSSKAWKDAFKKEHPVSEYGMNNEREDFAEAFMTLFGYLISVPGSESLSIESFKRLWPMRYAVLESIFAKLM